MLWNEFPLWQGARDRAQQEVNDAHAELEKVKLHLMEERPIEELMDSITFGKTEVTFTEGNTMLLQVTAGTKTAYQVAGVDAVLDGCLVAEVYEGSTKIGEAFLNLPRDGVGQESTMLKGHCLDAKPGGDYTVLLLPYALWVIEKYTYAKAVPTLDELIPNYKSSLSWKPVPTYPGDWHKILKERRQEAERRAAEEKAAAEVQAKKTKKIAIIATPIIIAIIAAMVRLSNSIAKQQEEAARLEAYNAAVALAEAGEYDEAIDAFTELGDYQDSAEQVLETTYNKAAALFAEGNYNRAISIFTELGGYKDSAEVAQQILDEDTAIQNAWAAYAEGDMEPIMALIGNLRYLELNEQDVENVLFLYPYVGTWEYLSDDARVVSMYQVNDSSNMVEYRSVETGLWFTRGDPPLPTIQVYFGNRSFGFKINFDSQLLEPTDKDQYGSVFYAELTPQDTLLITVERHDGVTVTCEYQRAG